MATEGRVLGEKYKPAEAAAGSEDSACPVCTKRNRTCETKYCIDCQEYFCSTCAEALETGIDHTSHIIADIQDFSTETDDNDKCEEHPEEPITSFCRQHDALCCGQCLQQEHGTCMTSNISDCYPELIDPGKKLETMETLKSAKEHVIKTIRAYHNIKETLSDEREKAARLIQDFRSSLEQTLKDLEKSTMENLSTSCARIESEFKENADTAERALSNLIRYERKLELQEPNNPQTFVNLKLAERQIHLSNHSSEMSLKPGVQNIHFEPDSKISSLLQEIEQLGTCNFFSYPLATGTVSSDRLKTPTNIRRGPLSMACAGQVCDLKVQGDENTCQVTGTCLTPDGTVLCVDYANKKLKRLDKTSYKVRDFLDLAEEPLDIAAISNGEAIVSLGQTIQFVSLGTNMELARSLDFSHYCQFLAYHDGKIFVFDGCDEIRIYSTTGTLLGRISTDYCMCGFTCSEDGNMIYIVDENEPCLAAVDVHGVMSWKRTAEELEMSGIAGVCVDGFGNVMVCGRSTDESPDVVVRVTGSGSPDGKWSGDNYYMPTSVCFDRNNSKIVLASYYGQQLLINNMY